MGSCSCASESFEAILRSGQLLMSNRRNKNPPRRSLEKQDNDAVLKFRGGQGPPNETGNLSHAMNECKKKPAAPHDRRPHGEWIVIQRAGPLATSYMPLIKRP